MNWSTAVPNMITGAATILGVGITMFFTNQRERRQLKQQRTLIGLQARREAYIEFMRAARLMARHVRQLVFYFEHRGPRVPQSDAEKVIHSKTDGLVGDLAAAEAAAQLHGRTIKSNIDRLYAAHNAFEPIFQDAVLAHQYDSERAKRALAEVEEAERLYLEACKKDIDIEQLGRPSWWKLGRGKSREIASG